MQLFNDFSPPTTDLENELVPARDTNTHVELANLLHVVERMAMQKAENQQCIVQECKPEMLTKLRMCCTSS